MPNWCFNILKVEADDAEDLKEFLAPTIDKEECFQFEYWLPQPESEEDWWGWNNNNWGTKWDADIAEILEDKRNEPNPSITFKFNTAWTPPRNFILAMTEKYPNLNFILSFDEEGCDVFGFMHNRDEEFLNSEHAEELITTGPRSQCRSRRLLAENYNRDYTCAWTTCDVCCGCDDWMEEHGNAQEQEEESNPSSSSSEENDRAWENVAVEDPSESDEESERLH